MAENCTHSWESVDGHGGLGIHAVCLWCAAVAVLLREDGEWPPKLSVKIVVPS